MSVTLDLSGAANAALDCLGVRRSDRVLILSNQPQRRIAEALASAARTRATVVHLLDHAPLSRDGEEPPIAVAQAMLEASVVFVTTSYSLSHTRARRQASAGGARIAGIYVSEDAFAGTLDIDYRLLRQSSASLAAALTRADSCRITSAAGTDITLSIKDRTATSDDGHLQQRSAFGNLPAGEAYIAPLETVGAGIIVFDGALAGYGLLSTPLRVRLEDGRAVAADGEAAQWLLATLDAGGEFGRSIAEIGIGTNPAARLCGDIAIDEKAHGTAHLAFGTSASFGGANQASVHIDGMLLAPTIYLNGKLLLDAGGPTEMTGTRTPAP